MSKIPLAKAFAPLLPIAVAIGACLLAVMVLAVPVFAAGSAGYTVKPACSAPAPGYAACLAERLVPSSATAVPSASAPFTSSAPSGAASPASPTPEPPGLSPQQLHKAYELPLESTEPQTIAIVDAYDDPNAEADLGVFDQRYGLPECTHANGCFTKVNQLGLTAPAPFPKANGEWSIEISTDIQVAHSVCQNCHILLVEAETAGFPDLEAAEDTAAALLKAASPPGTTTGEISNSWGGEESPVDSSAFNHPGIVITASSGDEGYLNWDEYNSRGQKNSSWFEGPSYPASSPRVVAVGGTKLKTSITGEWREESVWNHGNGAAGGGCSLRFAAPLWQSQLLDWSAVGCGSRRAVADIAADADPITGVEVYDSIPEYLGTEKEELGEEAPEYFTIGGTSVASPIIASTFALAGGAHGVAYPAATLYANAGSGGLHDITEGGNGECKGNYSGSPACSGSLASLLDCGAGHAICNAAAGYDGPTGVGTPIGLSAFQPVPGQTEGFGEGPPSGGSGGGGGTASPGNGSSTAVSPAPTPSNVASVKASSQVRVSGLSLTLAAVIALNRRHPSLAKVAFSFVLNAPVSVRITLARWVRVHGHWRWSTLRGANSLAAHVGINHAHLRGHGVLPSGRYRLTLTPLHGIASSIPISIG
jgi:hypothetical protein